MFRFIQYFSIIIIAQKLATKSVHQFLQGIIAVYLRGLGNVLHPLNLFLLVGSGDQERLLPIIDVEAVIGLHASLAVENCKSKIMFKRFSSPMLAMELKTHPTTLSQAALRALGSGEWDSSCGLSRARDRKTARDMDK